jgi:hypothetical protein
VEIVFRDGRSHRLFNDYRQLEERYGSDLASKIATRMAVLKAAKFLSAIPERPPIKLRQSNGSPVTFTVDLTPPRKLRFAPRIIGASDAKRLNRDGINSIDILGIE